MLVTGVLAEPLERVAALFNEIDLQPNFVPFLSRAGRIATVTGCGDHGQALANLHFYLPGLGGRDAVVFAFGCDASREASSKGSHGNSLEGFVLVVESIDGSEWWGHVLPENTGVPVLVKIGFILKPMGACNGSTSPPCSVTILLQTDLNLPPFIPHSLVHWANKQVAKLTFSNIEKISRVFDTSEYPIRMRQDPSFYRDFVEGMVLKNLLGPDWKSSTKWDYEEIGRKQSFTSCMS
jgi:hypothetical protein